MTETGRSGPDISRRLLAWYARYKRDLPWRRTRNPYHIWVAEIMLQQTRVDTAIPYYETFLGRFPSVEALAASPLDEVLKTWENLGYYARARNLHRAAQEMVRRFAGRVPETYGELRGLPGIGEYTAGAILSTALGKPVPAVDGNARRVLARLFAIQEPLEQGRTQTRLRELAQGLMPARQASAFNQALMELGAVLCTPKGPACGRCPIRADCLALRAGLAEVLPLRRGRGPLPCHREAAAVIQDRRGRLLVARRFENGLLGGLWKLPGGRLAPGEDPAGGLRRTIKAELGVDLAVGDPLIEVRHAYTHFRIVLSAWTARVRAGRPKARTCADWRWAAAGDLVELAFARADRKVLEALPVRK